MIPSKSLHAEILNAQLQLQMQDKLLSERYVALTDNVPQYLSSSSSLLLAGGVGFILGELSPTVEERFAVNNTQAQQASPLLKALDLINFLNSVYAAIATGLR